MGANVINLVRCVKCGVEFDRGVTRRKYCNDECRLPKSTRQRTTDKECIEPGCGRFPNGARGLCRRHYAQAKARGDFGGQQCRLDGCDRLATGFGFCRPHLGELRRSGKMPSTPCKVEGCERIVLSLGLCSMHYWRLRAKGDVGGPLPTKVPGTEWRDPNGYITQNGALQHRTVMESMLGRKLLPTETVHHINGVRHDNRPENLELWSKSQPAGQRVADKVAWAREILALYGELKL